MKTAHAYAAADEPSVNAPLVQHAQAIMEAQGFVPDATLQFGTWYDGNPRSLVYRGTWNAKRAVLKVYNETSPANQPEDTVLFDEHQTSTRMHVPELFIYEVESPNAGWMIMELIPERAQKFQSPMSVEQREQFLDAFMEYRAHMPLTATREVLPVYYDDAGNLIDAALFHAERVGRWRVLADAADVAYNAEGREGLLRADIARLTRAAQERIASVFAGQPLYWCHGHMKPNEIHYDAATREFWVTDFAHMTLFPRGYEFAFMIWADALMEFGAGHVNNADIVDGKDDPTQRRIMQHEADGALTTHEYIARVQEWMHAYNKAAQEYCNKEQLSDEVRHALILEPRMMHAALLERLLGALYADTIARVEIPYEQKQQRVELLTAVMQRALQDDLFK